MQSSEQITEASTDEAEESPEAPAAPHYHCVVTAQLHAREKIGSNKRPARKLLGKRTNAILDKHGLRSIIPAIRMFNTDEATEEHSEACVDAKYVHYTVLITFESTEPTKELELAMNELADFVVSAARPLFFRTNDVLSYAFDVEQTSAIERTTE